MEGPDRAKLDSAARAYLTDQLKGRAPHAIRLEGVFDEQPLEQEGLTAVFSFDLENRSGERGECSGIGRHYVAIGATEPTYFPAYGLDAEAAYSFHVGTRFMLGMRIERMDPALEPPGARDAVRAIASQHAPGVRFEMVELAALFRCGDDYFAVYRVRVDGEPAYFMGADCPPGVYHMADHPPQAALRLHLGQLIRAEARAERAGSGPHRPPESKPDDQGHAR